MPRGGTQEKENIFTDQKNIFLIRGIRFIRSIRELSNLI